MKALKQKDEDKIVLLENVSTISIDAERKRIVFNFMNPIQLVGRKTPDYHYFVYPTRQMAEEAFMKITMMPYIKLNFLISENPFNTDIVNVKAITSLHMDDEGVKIIFNLNYPITSYREKDSREVEISKVIFWNYQSDTQYEYDKLEISEILDLTEI